MSGNWRHRALCRDGDSELFFPIYGPKTEAYRDQVEMAKSVCAACPVREQCLEYAVDHQVDVTGVFGGTDEYERAALRKARVAA